MSINITKPNAVIVRTEDMEILSLRISIDSGMRSNRDTPMTAPAEKPKMR
jgi:hypothetical protein